MSSGRKHGHNPRHEKDKEIKNPKETTKNLSDEDRNQKIIPPETANAKNDDSNPQQGSLPRTHQEGSSNTVDEVSPSLMPHFESSPTVSDRHSKQHPKITPFKRDNRKLFVGGLPPNVTGAEFRDFFANYGTIVDSVVMIDRYSKRSRGFGFVTFEDESAAQTLLKSCVDGKEGPDGAYSGKICILGKMCEVKSAEPKEAMKKNANATVKSNGHRGETYASNQDGIHSMPSMYHRAPITADHKPFYTASENLHNNNIPVDHENYYYNVNYPGSAYMDTQMMGNMVAYPYTMYPSPVMHRFPPHYLAYQSQAEYVPWQFHPSSYYYSHGHMQPHNTDFNPATVPVSHTSQEGETNSSEVVTQTEKHEEEKS